MQFQGCRHLSELGWKDHRKNSSVEIISHVMKQKFKKFPVIIRQKWLPKKQKFLITLPEANVAY